MSGVLQIPVYRVCAFSDRPFAGNPAVVCVVPDGLPDALLQRIAAEHGPHETAFVRDDPAPGEGPVGQRWFSATQEVHLCGHATLAAAHVVLTRHPGQRVVRFATCGGPLDVHVDAAGRHHLALPVHRPQPVPTPPADLLAGLGAPVEAVLHAGRNFYVVLTDEATVRDLRPDLDRLARLHPDGVSVTAAGAAGSGTDFVSRYFAPSYGIPEDPVSGHPHCALVPYWAGRLGRDRLHGRQLSARGGEVACELRGEHVVVAGHVAPYVEGEIRISTPEEAPTATIPRSATSDVHPVPA